MLVKYKDDVAVLRIVEEGAHSAEQGWRHHHSRRLLGDGLFRRPLNADSDEEAVRLFDFGVVVEDYVAFGELGPWRGRKEGEEG